MGVGGVVCLAGVVLWLWIDPGERPAEAWEASDPAGCPRATPAPEAEVGLD